MVLPILLGIGITGIALITRSGLRAWSLYKTLSPAAIAKLNGITIKSSGKLSYDSRFFSNHLNSGLKVKLNEYQGGFFKKMSESEALSILNITSSEVPLLNESLVKRKHRAAMIKNHPDRGGSPYLAMKINEARDIILSGYMIKK
ncbi:hypothetical protein TPHA_0A00310 [Tetrapisispora phaffii CBS 4417]|uniref:J domain-containing protein n=1 Tax=Tetrapisispora phaffii (strain ATCC 24235 / CBS 4417 / NBRC 1672 / NRRL Y-8282 / UCD 70-5) TaxID=1071381 RepID=G8BMI8_TETPH|nr:hypothetical protein TPHA_0A00310 [Tetrapisispora phaffii CBS 4417]CCE61116.1 hypothetical protein TPHA_0A00310 [Tetrapisispora phaffii CBS 4417]